MQEAMVLHTQEARRLRRREEGRHYYRKLKARFALDPNLLEEYRRRGRERMHRYYSTYSREKKREIVEQVKRWRIKNIEHARQRERRRRLEIKLEAFSAYGGCCACCGVDDHEFLAIDHINGGGNKQRKADSSNGGIGLYYKLKATGYPQGYRVLCHNCNVAIGLWKRCPHEIKRQATLLA